MAYYPRAKLVLATELSAPYRSRFTCWIIWPSKPSLLQFGTSFESLNAAFLSLNLSVGTAEQKGNIGSNLISEGGLSCSQCRLRNEFVVLQAMSTIMYTEYSTMRRHTPELS